MNRIPYSVRATFGAVMTFAGSILGGAMIIVALDAGGPGPLIVALLAICTSALSAWMWVAAATGDAEARFALYYETQEQPAMPRQRHYQLPGEAQAVAIEMIDLAREIGLRAARAMEVAKKIDDSLMDVGAHLADVEADRERLSHEAAKVREMVAIASRAPREAQAPPAPLSPDDYGRRHATLVEPQVSHQEMSELAGLEDEVGRLALSSATAT